MNEYKLKIKCFMHNKYNCRLHDLFSEQSMWSTTSTTTAPSPLKIGSLVQLNEVEFAVYLISFELYVYCCCHGLALDADYFTRLKCCNTIPIFPKNFEMTAEKVFQ
jgi:hypothetical protein